MNKRIFFVLIAITMLGFFLRFWKLDTVPYGFQEDEVSIGYNTYSILKTGFDENGVHLPFYIDSFGDFRPALHYYLTIPSILIFGNTVFAVRIVAALIGTLTPLVVYFLVKKIEKDKEKLSFLSAFLLAVSPWHIVLSRAANDAVIALFFLLLAVYFFIDLLTNLKKKNVLFVILFSFLSFFSYHTPRIFLPLLLLATLIIFVKNKIPDFRKIRSGILTISVVALLSVALIFSIKGGTGRAGQVSILTTPDEKLILEEQLREDGGIAPLITRISHNKIINYGLRFISNYSEYFTMDFLFLKGGLPPRYTVPNMGLFYLIESPFILMGIYELVRRRGRSTIWLFWFILGPLVSAITLDDIPNVQRSIFMLPAGQIIIAYGFLKLKNNISIKFINFIIFIIFILSLYNFYYFLHQYFHHSIIHRTWYRNDGFVELAKFLPGQVQKYDRIVITKSQGSVYNYLLYFNSISPSWFLLQKLNIQAERWGFGKYEFAPGDCPLDFDKKALYVCKDESVEPAFYTVIDKIYRNDNTPVFKLMVLNPNAPEKQ